MSMISRIDTIATKAKMAKPPIPGPTSDGSTFEGGAGVGVASSRNHSTTTPFPPTVRLVGNRIAWIKTNRLEARMSSALDARYGRTPARRRTARWWAIGVAIAVAAVVAAWVAWVGLL